ncbi:hypothetical protein ACH5RR_031979 [Cinchona calisaya]|uniref:Glycine-rich protein n=1 Tax=Cinchona calisaya TaxID=153742 RepID=A0ABD2YL70_9GENT
MVEVGCERQIGGTGDRSEGGGNDNVGGEWFGNGGDGMGDGTFIGDVGGIDAAIGIDGFVNEEDLGLKNALGGGVDKDKDDSEKEQLCILRVDMERNGA